MGEFSLKYRALVTGLTVWVGLCGTALPQSAGRFPSNRTPQKVPFNRKPSMAESFTSTLKQGTGKLVELLSPKTPVKPAEDPVSLASPGKPRVNLYLAVARMYEQAGKLDEAAEQYRKALKQTPNHLGALLRYAQLKQRQGKLDEAIKLYKQAAKVHPNEASVFNNLGSFYSRRGMLDESVTALKRAIWLQPKNPKYRNNLAIVLVEKGLLGEAFRHLSVVHGEAVAYYNLGFVLYKKGQTKTARQHFATALRKDPSLVPARQMLERLADVSMEARAPGIQPSARIRLSNRPTRPTPQARPDNHPLRGGQRPVVQALPPVPKRGSPYDARQDKWRGRVPSSSRGMPTPPERSLPWRPPPTPQRPVVEPRTAPLPSGHYNPPPVPTAPLPPVSGRL